MQITCKVPRILFDTRPLALPSAGGRHSNAAHRHNLRGTCFSPQRPATSVTGATSETASYITSRSGRMGMLFLVCGAQKVLKALPQGWKAMTHSRWSWQRVPWLQPRLQPPPPPPSVREAITAALSDPCWARWVHTLHRNIVAHQQVRWYHLVLCVTLMAMLIVHALERLDRRRARRDSLAHTAHRRHQLRAAYLRQLARDEQAHNLYPCHCPCPLRLPL